MARLSAVAVGTRTGWGSRIDGEIRLKGRRRLAAGALLCMAGILFMTPPVVALLVIGGLVR